MDEFADIAAEAWDRPIKHAIFDIFNQPFLCRICDKNENWVIERVLPDGTPIMSCSHGTAGDVIRQVDTVNGQRIFRAVELGPV